MKSSSFAMQFLLHGMIFFASPKSNPYTMNDAPSGLKQTAQDVLEVKFWEIYLLQNRNNLYSALRGYALDKGPLLKNARDAERVVFRFMKYDWEKTLLTQLTNQSIPFEIIRSYKTDVVQQMAKKKVYVAEDDLSILFALDVMLEEAGYEVRLSHCGNPFMEENLPATDLFILDNRMPDVNGIDICRHLKSRPDTEHIPIIMISALRGIASQARKAGVDEFVEKPFQMQNLLNLVSRYTQNSGQLVH
jgi:CheY-like chemotaxis protein